MQRRAPLLHGWRKAVLLFVLLLVQGVADASHIIGADFYYEYISGNSYKVSLAIYGDCNGTAFPSLATSTPQVILMDNNANVSTSFLDVEGPGVEVTPVCASQRSNTTCNGGSIPGITRFIYSKVIAVPYTSAGWHFRFTGAMARAVNTSQAGRSSIITNLVQNGSSIMVLDIALNNVPGPNSSPRFTTIPTPFYCINTAQQYNPGAVDANNDSLYYVLAPALETGGQVIYVPGYSATSPLGVVPGSFSFNNITGQLNFTPNLTQNSTVVTRVDEYRNGVKVGSATREMNFTVLANCTGNTPPFGAIDTTAPVTGGVLADATTLNVCEGTNSFSFRIRPLDLEGDSIEITLNGLPAAINVGITGNNTNAPVINVSNVNAAGLAPGIYTFFLTYKDSHCPISSQQTQAFTVRIIRPNTFRPQVLYPTYCLHKAYVEYQMANGLLPRTVTIQQGATTIRTFLDNSGIFRDSLAPGTYTATISSPLLPCPTVQVFTISDSGAFPFPPTIVDAFYCRGDAPMPLAVTRATGTPSTLFWIDTLGNSFTSPPTPNTNTPGIFRWYAVERYKTCESPRDTGYIYVTNKPVADFVISPAVVCDLDTATVRFTGSVGSGPFFNYRWDWHGADVVIGAAGGPYRVHWPASGVKVVTLSVVENQCPSDTVTRSLQVKPSPRADFSVENICQYDTMRVAYTANALAGQTYAWSFDGADLPSSTAPGPFRLQWSSGGTKHISLVVAADGCMDSMSKYPQVYGLPDAEILNVPGATCLGDKVYLEHTGAGTGATFTWLPKTQVYTDRDGRVYTFTTRPTTYSLIVSNAQGCADTSYVTYNQIEPCCNFAYPDAFTPNGDGKNDQFHVLTYGNDANFSLSIYNRWGQRVYHSGDPKQGWDGKLNGQDCDMGTYFYVLQATCLTGHEEYRKGELTLIR